MAHKCFISFKTEDMDYKKAAFLRWFAPLIQALRDVRSVSSTTVITGVSPLSPFSPFAP